MTKERTRARTPNNKTTTGFRISDELWEVLQPLLPEHRNTHPLGGGRPRRGQIESAPMPFSTCCAPVASGRPWMRPIWFPAPPPMTVSKNG